LNLNKKSIMTKIITITWAILLISCYVFSQNSIELHGDVDVDEQVTTATSFAANTAFSIEGWIYADDVTHNRRLLNFSAGTIAILSGKLSYSGGCTFSDISTTNIPTSTWTHFALTVTSSGTIKGYINGALEVTDSECNTFAKSNWKFGGRFGSHGSAWNGKLDEFRFWNGVLSDADIGSIYNKTFTDPTSPAACLQAYYQMTDGSGTSLTDNSGNGNTGTFSGSVTWSGDEPTLTSQAAPTCSSLGLYANSLEFDNVDDYVSIPHSSDFNITSNITIEAWIKTAGTGQDYITTKGENSWYLGMNIPGFGNKVAFFLSGVTGSWIASTSNINDGNWHHVAATYDGANVKIYVDGVLETTSAQTGTINTGTSAVEIGRRGSLYFDGKIDEVRIWNVALEDSDITALYNKTFIDPTSPSSCLVAYYKMTDGTGTSVTDDSGNGHTGTINGGGTWVTDDEPAISSATAPACASLPVELTYFRGQSLSETIALNWQTATEENNEGFEIQRSKDGRNWENIGFIAGNGTTFEIQNYEFIDDAPMTSVNYYRLKQMDYDGGFEFSKIVTIAMEQWKNEAMKIFPNPVQNELNVVNGQGQAIIYNMLGQPVREFVINNEQSTINISDLPNGQYILQISQQNGNTQTQRFIRSSLMR
jgi:hypothetical protein